MPYTTGSQLLVDCLLNEGVEYVFGVPGEENVQFLEALASSSIQFINAADERGAGFMAIGYARSTGKAGVVATTLGPGALNLPNPLALAQIAGIPLVALTWQRGLFQSNKDHGFQYVNIQQTFQPLTKFQLSLHSPDQIPSAVRDLFTQALTPKQGATHLEVPEDVAHAKVNLHTKPIAISNPPIPNVSSLLITDAVNLLTTATRPIMLVGYNATKSPTTIQSLQKFITDFQIHTITTPMAQGILPSNHPLSLHSFSYPENDLLHRTVQQSDLVIACGYDISEYSPRNWHQDNSQQIIHLNDYSSPYHSHYQPSLNLIGDMAHTLKHLTPIVPVNRTTDYTTLQKVVNQNTVSKSFPIQPQFLVQSMRNLGDNTVLVHDNGLHKLWVSRYFRPSVPNQVIVDNALATMASGISQGIAIKMTQPHQKVIVNIGEGGLLMCMGEIATAVALNISLTILVWHDGEYGMISWHQKRKGITKCAVTIPPLNIAQLAAGFGAQSFTVSSAQALPTILRTATNLPSVCLIDCPVDYSQSTKIFPGYTTTPDPQKSSPATVNHYYSPPGAYL